MDYQNITIGQLIVVVGAVVAFIKFVDWGWAKFIDPHIKHQQIMSQYEADIKEIKEILKRDYAKLSNHDIRLSRLEVSHEESNADRKDLHESVRVTMVALQALLKSRLENDNNVSGIKSAEKEIEHYLQSKL